MHVIRYKPDHDRVSLTGRLQRQGFRLCTTSPAEEQVTVAFSDPNIIILTLEAFQVYFCEDYQYVAALSGCEGFCLVDILAIEPWVATGGVGHLGGQEDRSQGGGQEEGQEEGEEHPSLGGGMK